MGEGRNEICRRHAEAADMTLGAARAAASTENAPPDGIDQADTVIAVSAPLNLQWDGVRDAGLGGFPLPEIWHQSP